MKSSALLSIVVALTGLTAPATPAAAVPAPAHAASVSMIRTGGIAGDRSAFQIAGSGTAHSRQVLRLASSPAFRALGPRYVPKNTCCDRFSYEIKVGYRNGRVKRVTYLQGTPRTPRVLTDLIRLMENMPKPKPVTFPPGFPFN